MIWNIQDPSAEEARRLARLLGDMKFDHVRSAAASGEDRAREAAQDVLRQLIAVGAMVAPGARFASLVVLFCPSVKLAEVCRAAEIIQQRLPPDCLLTFEFEVEESWSDRFLISVGLISALG